MATLQDIRKSYSKPEVQAYLDAQQKQKVRDKHGKRWAVPAVATGLIGAGMGATWIGDHALTPEDRSKLDNLRSLSSRMSSEGLGGGVQNEQFKGSPQMFYDYVDRASQAAGAKLFGMTAPEVIEKIRKSVLFRGSAFDLAKANKFDLAKTEEHYGDFQAGPLAAYLHQLRKHDEAFGTTWGATQRYIDPKTEEGSEGIKKWLDMADRIPGLSTAKAGLQGAYSRMRDGADVMVQPLLPGVQDASGGNSTLAAVLNHVRRQNTPGRDTYHEFRTTLEDYYNKFLKSEGVAKDDNASGHIREISQALPHGQEMDLVRKFKGWVEAKDPEFGKQLGSVESQMAEGMAGPTNMYGMGGNIVAKLFQDLPRAVGAAAVAGGAGLGGWWLYSKLRNRALKKDLRRKALAARNVLEQPTNQKTAYMNTSLYAALGPLAKQSSSYPGYTNHNVQTMLPMSSRRDLSPGELQAIQHGQQQWIPKIFENLSDSPAVRMTDPARSAALGGALLGVPAALLTASGTGSAGVGLGVGLGAGGLAALISYMSSRQNNQNIEETMRRIPAGSNLRDFDADPLVTERRRFEQQAALATMMDQTRFY